MILALIAAALAYPTVVWTVVLSFLALYWLLVAGGALDAEALGGVDGAGEAALEGASSHADLSDAAGLLSRLGLRQVPLTVLATAVALLNFAGCHYATRWFGPLGWGAATAVMAGVFVLSLPVAGLATRPLRPLFVVHEAPSRAALIGKVGIVSTGRVDDRFGQARISDGGAGLIVDVRAHPDLQLKRGERVLLVAWDTTAQAFDVDRDDTGGGP